MKQTIIGASMPTAQICINKSRIKIYNKETTPTYYLEKGQEFQIELFNPTSDTLLAKIQLNGNQISQGGLVLRLGERVFLERYLDVAKKFKFDTYEVANTVEVKKAIEDNGDFKVEFYKESQPKYYYGNSVITVTTNPYTLTGTYNTFNLSSNIGNYNPTIANTSYNASSSNISSTLYSDKISTIDSLSSSHEPLNSLKKLKTIETGRVETGGQSDQKLEYVNKSFDYYPFYTMEYKLLPVSQKINTVSDINIKKYCTNCGKKYIKTDKFCSQCGAKV